MLSKGLSLSIQLCEYYALKLHSITNELIDN